MKIAFINLPFERTIVRRYMCTYHSAMMKLAPYELLQLAACAREWNDADICFMDAIAEECGEAEVHAFLACHHPDVVAALIGIETVSADLACMDRIKAAFPNIAIVVFGHYPTIFPEEILEKSRVDAILRNEPEKVFSDYLDARKNGMSLRTIPGLAARDEQGAVFANPPERMLDLDTLPFPDFSLCDMNRYEEWLLGGPCGVLLSARGCPFTCTYCTTTYGRRLVAKKPETVVAELKAMCAQGIRVVRFLDDTFTFSSKRVIAICKGILEEGLPVIWSCLGRIDTLDADMLGWMKKAGCVRIAVGIESYSPKVLEYLGKTGDPATFNARLQQVRDAGIECAGTFMVGAPVETEADFQQTLRELLRSPIDLIGVNVVTPYAGTPYFDRVKDDLIFSLIPYECRFRDRRFMDEAVARERRLYRRFYLRPSVMLRQLRAVMRFPGQSLRLLGYLLRAGMVNQPISGYEKRQSL
ncbi:MAG TPA: radical SAM protein [Candidatus Hydrogenedentes bacterium]|nr:radical SAM protein [Candidatus Hydrogenedentota bacterium]